MGGSQVQEAGQDDSKLGLKRAERKKGEPNTEAVSRSRGEAEGRSQRAEARSQKPEGRKQKAEGRMGDSRVKAKD